MTTVILGTEEKTRNIPERLATLLKVTRLLGAWRENLHTPQVSDSPLCVAIRL